jgi:tetratricopeptide (TPR) repeat protein
MSRTQAILRWQLKDDEYHGQFRQALDNFNTSTGTDDAHTGILAHGPAQQLQKVWQVPLQRNLHFLGREDSLEKIEFTFDKAKGPTVIALSGLGGVGKSQLALEYTYRYMKGNYVVAWIRAESLASTEADFVALATALGLAEASKADMRAVMSAVHAWLETNDNWFLVLDNVEGPDTLQKILPRHLRGRVLITTRYQGWGSRATSLPLTPFRVNEARDFVLDRTDESDVESAQKLVTRLGGLPLALEEACAYMDATGRSIGGYLKLFESHHNALLSRSQPRGDYPATLQTTWEVSFMELEKSYPEAVRLVNLLAFLGPDDLPESLLLSSDVPLDGELPDPIEFDDLIAALRRYSLIKVDIDAVSIHRLVQLVIRDRMTREMREYYALKALELIDKAFPASGAVGDMLPDCGRLLPHAITALAHTDGLAKAEVSAGRLLGRTGTYQCARGSLQEGVGQIVKAYHLLLKQGEVSFDFAHACELYGRVQYQCGNLDEARSLLNKALKILEQVGDPDGTNIPQCLTLMAWICWSIGDTEAALRAAEESTRIISEKSSIQDPLTLSGQSITGRLLMDQGRVAEAIEVTDHCVSVIESLGGARHPLMCGAFLQISQVLLYAGMPVRARSWAQEALNLGIPAYGNHHPLVAGAHCIMGQVLLYFGEFDQALQEFETAIEYVRLVPTKISQHAAIAGSFKIETLLHLGRNDEAAATLEECQSVFADKVAGEATRFHTRAIMAAAKLDSLNGDSEAAIRRIGKVDESIKSRFGEQHHFRVPGLLVRAEVLMSAGLTEEAREDLDFSLDLLRSQNLEDHPQAVACLAILAQVADSTGESGLAREYRQEAVKGLRSCVGPMSPVTIALEKELTDV